jgi:hypothetical protein
MELLRVRRALFEKSYKGLIEQYHYLGYTQPVWEHLEYIAFSQGRPLARVGWCSARRHIGCRGRYLGWTKEQGLKNLSRVHSDCLYDGLWIEKGELYYSLF